jgi:hypothetical protein
MEGIHIFEYTVLISNNFFIEDYKGPLLDFQRRDFVLEYNKTSNNLDLVDYGDMERSFQVVGRVNHCSVVEAGEDLRSRVRGFNVPDTSCNEIGTNTHVGFSLE